VHFAFFFKENKKIIIFFFDKTKKKKMIIFSETPSKIGISSCPGIFWLPSVQLKPL